MFIDSGLGTIENWNAGKDPYRVAPYSLIPTPWPFQSAGCSQRGVDICRTLESKYMKIIQNHQVTYQSITCRSIWRKSFPSEATDTLVIYSLDDDTSNWQLAATEIFVLFIDAGISNTEIKIEICNPMKMYRDVSSCIPDDHQILGAIRDVEPRVYDVVREKLGLVWTTIAYHMRGPKDDLSTRKPTVLVTCKPGSWDVFERVEAAIEAVLQSEKFPGVSFHLEILPGFVELAAPPSQNKEAWGMVYHPLKPKPQNGASIGIENQELGAGTLGGWVIFKQNDPSLQPLKCALTCYHVISKGDTANLPLNDRYGIGPNGQPPRSKINIVYPALFDALETKRKMREHIFNNNDPTGSRQRTLQGLYDLEAAGPIGYVRYASGLRRTAEQRRLDWALIVSPETFTQNKPPPAGAFDSSALWNGNIEWAPGPEDYITKFGAIKEGDWVAKAGRSTTTSGEVNKIRRRVHWNDHPDSYETEVIGIDRNFASGGDSGSWVINSKQELVGLLIGSEPMSSSWGCGLVTPIDIIKEDLRAMAKGDIILP